MFSKILKTETKQTTEVLPFHGFSLLLETVSKEVSPNSTPSGTVDAHGHLHAAAGEHGGQFVKKETPEYEVPVHNIAYLQDKVDKLNKKAAKLGVTPIKLHVGESYTKEVEKATATKPARHMEFHKVKVEGEAPKLNGWGFIGKREPLEGTASVLVKSAPGETLPNHFHDDHKLKCEHCGVNHQNRKATFVVRHDDGTHKEVGSSCLKDFLGHADPHKHADFAEALYNIKDALANSTNHGGGFGNPEYLHSMEDMVAPAIRAIHEHSFVSRQYEGVGKPATASRVYDHINPPPVPHNYPAGEWHDMHNINVQPKDKEEAHKVVEWIKNHPKVGKEEFFTNLAKIMSTDAASLKHLGYIAAGAHMYLKAMDQEAAKVNMKDSLKNEPLAAVGAKVEVKGTVLRRHSWDGQYGSTHRVTVRADSGHLVHIKTTTDAGAVDKGDRVHITGKIGDTAPDSYEQSPFKGIITNTMAPRSKIKLLHEDEPPKPA